MASLFTIPIFLCGAAFADQILFCFPQIYTKHLINPIMAIAAKIDPLDPDVIALIKLTNAAMRIATVNNIEAIVTTQFPASYSF